MAIHTYKVPFQKLDEQGNPIPIKKNPELLRFVILIFFKDSEEKTFEILTGRSNCYDYLKENIENIDILQSQVISESTTMDTWENVYSYFKLMEKYYPESDFRVEDYIDQESVEDAENIEYNPNSDPAILRMTPIKNNLEEMDI